jgi:serine/threonine protein kinase, bacterial
VDEIGSPPPWWRRQRLQVKLAVITGIVVVLAAAGITSYLLLLSPPALRQTVLPFTGLNNPNGVAVDTAGNLYVPDMGNNRMVKLPAG